MLRKIEWKYRRRNEGSGLSLWSRRRLSDVANVVLDELPVIAALHPDMRAAVGWLPVDRSPVRHDRQFATIEETDHVLVSHVGVLSVFEAGHILCLVFDLAEWGRASVVVSHDAADCLTVVIIEPQLCRRPLLV